jgi:diaminohydroxyphosphoribosylaminopyrimidine deaminase / 5-amino-6-(5-phosphoribosylamino)uracil reductase
LAESTPSRPYTLLSCCVSLDGCLDDATERRLVLSNDADLDRVDAVRAGCDAILVGAGTVRADDPQLTVRSVSGPNPVRVVIDPRGTLPADARAFANDGVRRIVITRLQTCAVARDVETISLPDNDGRIEPRAILDALGERGLHRVLIEGGAKTVSSFLSAGCLDRLHVVVAPMILGSGIAGLDLPPIADMTGALRMPMRAHALGSDVLFDCDLRSKASAGR